MIGYVIRLRRGRRRGTGGPASGGSRMARRMMVNRPDLGERFRFAYSLRKLRKPVPKRHDEDVSMTATAPGASSPEGPSFTAVQEQLGLDSLPFPRGSGEGPHAPRRGSASVMPNVRSCS
ncbi:MAG: hypothetical protein DMF90_25000 [Acidobacteria bacterium]|nr:MAG: hypothetical protein DMF90_25000 [Acidobacteriota bacterium]